jgi:hypothetical protein
MNKKNKKASQENVFDQLPVEIWLKIILSLTSVKDIFKNFALTSRQANRLVKNITGADFARWLDSFLRRKLIEASKNHLFATLYPARTLNELELSRTEGVHQETLQHGIEWINQAPLHSLPLLDVPFDHLNFLGQEYIQLEDVSKKGRKKTFILEKNARDDPRNPWLLVSYDLKPPPEKLVKAFSEWALPLYREHFAQLLPDVTADTSEVTKFTNKILALLLTMKKLKPNTPKAILEAFFQMITPTKLPETDARHAIISDLAKALQTGHLIDNQFLKKRIPEGVITGDALHWLREVTESLIAPYQPLTVSDLFNRHKHSKDRLRQPGDMEDFQLAVTLFNDYMNPKRIPDLTTRHDLSQRCMHPFVTLSKNYPWAKPHFTEHWIKVLDQLLEEKKIVNGRMDELANNATQLLPVQRKLDKWIVKMSTLPIASLQLQIFNHVNPERFRVQEDRYQILKNLETFGKRELRRKVAKQNEKNEQALDENYQKKLTSTTTFAKQKLVSLKNSFHASSPGLLTSSRRTNPL